MSDLKESKLKDFKLEPRSARSAPLAKYRPQFSADEIRCLKNITEELLKIPREEREVSDDFSYIIEKVHSRLAMLAYKIDAEIAAPAYAVSAAGAAKEAEESKKAEAAQILIDATKIYNRCESMGEAKEKLSAELLERVVASKANKKEGLSKEEEEILNSFMMRIL